MSDHMRVPPRTARTLSVLVCAAALSGCHNRRTAEQSPPACHCRHAGVLAELGLAQTGGGPTPADHAESQERLRAPGPSLVAGDHIAWGWAVLYGQASQSETPAWVYAGVFTE